MFLHVWWALFVETRFVELKVFFKNKTKIKKLLKLKKKDCVHLYDMFLEPC